MAPHTHTHTQKRAHDINDLHIGKQSNRNGTNLHLIVILQSFLYTFNCYISMLWSIKFKYLLPSHTLSLPLHSRSVFALSEIDRHRASSNTLFLLVFARSFGFPFNYYVLDSQLITPIKATNSFNLYFILYWKKRRTQLHTHKIPKTCRLWLNFYQTLDLID